MVENNFEIKKRVKSDDKFIYEVHFDYVVELSTSENIKDDIDISITAILYLANDTQKDSILIEKSEFYSFNYNLTDSIAQVIFDSKIKPLL